jgi:Zn finger protein HypA/HybF involved in hydrogenase expression
VFYEGDKLYAQHTPADLRENNLGKRRGLSDEDKEFIERAISSGETFDAIAIHLGVCTDTAKRYAVRLGIVSLEGAKYQVSNRFRTEYWTRPCIKCHKETKRPKWQFICSRCTAANARDHGGIGDDWQFE